MYSYHIILDFEMNPVLKTNKAVRAFLHNEIIEIGAVKLNSNYEIIDRFQCFVRPEYNKEVTPYITRLTGIKTPQVFVADSLASALADFVKWVGNEKTRIYSWSENDLEQLRKECSFKRIDFPDNLKRWMDFQAIYSRVMGMDRHANKMALHIAASQYGIQIDMRKAHRALYDAEVTTKLIIPVLTGEYQTQVQLLQEASAQEVTPITQSLGDIYGDLFKRMLKQVQIEPVIS